MSLQCRICGKEFPEFDQRGFRNAGFTAHQNRCIERERQHNHELVGRRSSSRVVSAQQRRLLPAPANATNLFRRQHQQEQQLSTDLHSRRHRSQRRRSVQTGCNASISTSSTTMLQPISLTSSATLSVSTYYHSQPMVVMSESTPILLCTAPPMLIPITTTMQQENILSTPYHIQRRQPPTSQQHQMHLASQPTQSSMPHPHTAPLDFFPVHYCDYCTPQNGLHDPSCPLISFFGPSNLGT